MKKKMCVSLYSCAVVIVVGMSITSGGHPGHPPGNLYRSFMPRASPGTLEGRSHEHGIIVMGVPNDHCDNAQWRLDVDWENSTDLDYKCQPEELPTASHKSTPILSCIDNADIPLPLHKCMTEEIFYSDQPPRGGSHRPLWPVYGEYLYLPPQRWVHSLEHGAAVFLFHPCADTEQIELLKSVARSCLRRHIITPYRHLPHSQSLAIVTYGCKLTMSHVNVKMARQFVQENALNPARASEVSAYSDGQYSVGLLQKAELVSDIKDRNLCPTEARMMREETMI